jgi:hypothetical protein
MAHALVERVTGRPADVPEPVALNLVMSDQAFPRVGPQFGRPAWQSHPVAYLLPMASLHEQQSCCWIADNAAPLEAEYSWRSGRIPTVRYSFSPQTPLGGRAHRVWSADVPCTGTRGRLLDAWDRHLSHPALPQTLAPRLREAGFTDVSMAGHTFATTALDPETYGGAFTPLIV